MDGPARKGPALILDAGRRLSVDYRAIWELTRVGPQAGPAGLTVLEGEQAQALLTLLDLEPARLPTAAPAAPPALPDGSPTSALDRWFRQALVGQKWAIETALRDLDEGRTHNNDSLRRLAGATAQRVERFFPDLARTARLVTEQSDADLREACRSLLYAMEAEFKVAQEAPVRILVVEDDPVSALQVTSFLEAPGREVHVAGSCAEANELLANHRMDLAILDQSLPDRDGRDLLLELRTRPATSAMPIVVVSGADGVGPRSEGYALGADAYFVKPVHPAVIASAVSAFLLRAAQIRDEALNDPLTGLKTRTVLIQSLEDTWSALLRQGDPIAFGILDVDRFQAYNDLHGRETGDRVLYAVGLAIKKALRRSDLLARWADDSFALALPNTSFEDAQTAVSKITAALLTIRDPRTREPLPHVSASIGMVALHTAESLEDGFMAAERRVQAAARAGGNRAVWNDEIARPEESTILLVEDDPLTARLILERLRRDGYQVLHIDDGLDALDITADVDITAVVLDVSTPGTDGFGLLRRLRGSPSFAHVPIMMLTMEREAQVAKAFHMGATDILRKPFALSELSARVQRLMVPR